MSQTPTDCRAVDAPRMTVRESLQVLVDTRRADTIVVTNQGAARVWPLLESHPFDFHYNPSTMGGAVPLGLGFALAQKSREVIVVTGDGALLMSLGSLVSLVASGAANLTVVVLENGIYEVTGSQITPGAQANVEFESIGEAANFSICRTFADLEDWRNEAPRLLAEPGPRLIVLRVHAAHPDDMKTASPSMVEQIARISSNLMSPPGS